jgi:xylulokinase
MDGAGKVLATHTIAHTLQTSRPGWTEQAPEEWWSAAQASVRGVLKKARLRGGNIRAIGLSGQMHGSVFLDKGGKVLRPALLWNDQRTARQSEEIVENAGGEARMLEMVGNLPLTGYTVPKILWFRQNEPKKYARCTSILLPKDYVRYRMTGDLATDVGDASGMCLLDVKRRDWSDELLGILEIDKALLPKLYESPAVTGGLSAEGARALGLREGTPVVAGSGDVMTGAVGNGIVEAGLINANVGTGGVMCAYSDEPALDNATEPIGRIATMCHAVPGAYVLFGCMLSAAGSLQWYADQFCDVEKALAKKQMRSVFEVVLELAEKAPPGCEGLFFLPYLTGERCPCPDPDARAGWIGATRRTDRPMIIRSIVEGVTFNMNAMLKIMRDQMGIPVKQVRATGGGARSRLWRQIQADTYDAPLAITNAEEGAAFGAAVLAGVGAGAFESVPAACRRLIKPTEVLRPARRSAARYARHQAVYDRLYGDLADRFKQMAALAGAS